MTEKKIKRLFYYPVAIIISLLLVPFKLIMLVGWLIYKPMNWFIEEVRYHILHKYNLFLLRHCDEAKDIKNKEARRILGFKD